MRDGRLGGSRPRSERPNRPTHASSFGPRRRDSVLRERAYFPDNTKELRILHPSGPSARLADTGTSRRQTPEPGLDWRGRCGRRLWSRSRLFSEPLMAWPEKEYRMAARGEQWRAESRGTQAPWRRKRNERQLRRGNGHDQSHCARPLGCLAACDGCRQFANGGVSFRGRVRCGGNDLAAGSGAGPPFRRGRLASGLGSSA